MPWPPTQAQVEQIPEIYRDFLRVLQVIPESRGRLLQISGLPAYQVFDSLKRHHPALQREQFLGLKEKLKVAGMIEEDKFSFLVPTARGESLIRAIEAHTEPTDAGVPDFPEF